MQTPFEVTVDLKLVVHAETASEAQIKARKSVASVAYPGASAIFAVLGARRLAHAELQDVQPSPHPSERALVPMEFIEEGVDKY